MSGISNKKPFHSAVVPLSKGGSDLIITSVVVTSLATFWVGLRFYSRHIRGVRVHREDYMIIVALILMYAATICIFLMIFLGGIGHHLYELQPSHAQLLLKISVPLQVLYAASIGVVKCSICVTLSRILFLHPFRFLAFIAMGLSIAWSLITILIGLLICQPLSTFWNPATPGGHCGNMKAAFTVVGILNVVTDLIIMVLPLRIVWQLQVPVANKIGLACVFALGILTMIAAAIRTVAVLRMSFDDMTFEMTIQIILCITEIGVGIVVACSPFLRPLFDRLIHGVVLIRDSRLGKNSSGFTKSSAATKSDYDPELGKSMGNSDVALYDVGGLITQTLEGGSWVGSDEERDTGSARTESSNIMYGTTVLQQ